MSVRSWGQIPQSLGKKPDMGTVTSLFLKVGYKEVETGELLGLADHQHISELVRKSFLKRIRPTMIE